MYFDLVEKGKFLKTTVFADYFPVQKYARKNKKFNQKCNSIQGDYGYIDPYKIHNLAVKEQINLVLFLTGNA